VGALQQSKLRVNWAGKKLEQFERLIQVGGKAAIEAVSHDSDPDMLKAFRLFRRNIHDEAMRLISEFVHHSRASLDYIVFALALFDSDRRIERTYFPIYDCKKRFEADRYSRKRGSPLAFFKHLTDEHVAMIESFQPYNGFDSLLPLQSLSNLDKHREFVRFNFMGSYWEGSDFIGDAKARLARREVEVNIHHLFQILFNDGTTITKSLQQLRTLISQILNEFDASLE
jgi:hypothetical protein